MSSYFGHVLKDINQVFIAKIKKLLVAIVDSNRRVYN